MERTLPRFRQFLARAATRARPRPATGRLWLDGLWLLVIGALHHTVLPSVFGSFLLVDLMTPWLVITFVVESLPRAAFIGLFGALIVETHSTTPGGLYICAYWVLAVALHVARGALSWRHVLPWVVAFAVSELWIIAFEALVIGINTGRLTLTTDWFVLEALRLLVATAIGLTLAWRYAAFGLPQEAG